MTLWTLGEIADAIGVSMAWKNAAITSVHNDSREVKPGGLFFALKGEQMHGHAFVPQAVQKGAAAVVVEAEQPGVDVPQLVVPDSYAALVALAKAARARFKGPVVAITGSAGKTTTKEMLAAMLQAHAPVGSFNNHVGVPLTLCRLPRDAKAYVAEIGMNHPGEIAPLSRMVQPDVAVVTNVLPAHMEGMGSLEAIRKEKLSIAAGLKNDGVLWVLEGLETKDLPYKVQVEYYNPKAPLPGPLQEPSPARVACANAALAVVRTFGFPEAEALNHLAGVPALPGRGGVEYLGGITLIDDSYNANPGSMVAALKALAARTSQGRKIALLGDMRELGPEGPRYHAELLSDVQGLDGVILVGPLMEHLAVSLSPAQNWGWVKQASEIDWVDLKTRLKPGDTLLVKASNSVLYVPGAMKKLREVLAG